MKAQYKLVRMPNPNKGEEAAEKQPLHARLVSCGTMHTKELVERVGEASSFTPAVLRGCLQALRDHMLNYLEMGYNVELEGFGTFSLSLHSKPVMDKKKIRAEGIKVDGLNFRPCKELKRKLSSIQVERSDRVESDPTYFSKEECERRVFTYLENHSYLTQQIYINLCHCSRTKASQDLNRLVAEGQLICSHFGRNKLYKKPKN